MTVREMYERFEFHLENLEGHKFDRVESPRHPRPDLCALLVLHDLDPTSKDAISYSTTDEIYFSMDPEVVAGRITEEQIVTLVRCGVWFSRGQDCFGTTV